MTDTNSTPTPPGDSASGGHTPASQQPVPLQPTQPAPYSAQGTQPYGGQQAYAGHAGYGAQQPYGYGAQQAPGSAQHSASQPYGQQTYEAEPVSMHAQHAAPKGNGGKTFLIAFAVLARVLQRSSPTPPPVRRRSSRRARIRRWPRRCPRSACPLWPPSRCTPRLPRMTR